MVAATIRTIFAQTTAEAVRTQLDVVADVLGRQFPQVKTMLLDAATDITAFADFPSASDYTTSWDVTPLVGPFVEQGAVEAFDLAVRLRQRFPPAAEEHSRAS